MSQLNAPFPFRRVVVLTPSVRGWDGVSEVARQTVAALAGPGGPEELEVWSLLDSRPPDPDPSAGRARYRAAGGSRFRMFAWGAGEAFGRSRDSLFHAVHLHLAPVARGARRRAGRLSIFLHGIEAWVPLRGQRARGVAAADVLISNSAFTARRFRETNPDLATRPAQPCWLGIPDDDLAPQPPPPGSRDALIVGRLAQSERYKGHDLLLEAWPRILASVPDARLLVVGEGDDRVRLEAKARSAGLEGRVQFLGALAPDACRARYREAALFAMPSTGEGFGLVYLEAMRAARACVAAPGAADEIVEDGVTGRIVDPRDSLGVADTLAGLLSDSASLAGLGAAGRHRYLSQFTAEKFSSRFMDILTKYE